MKKIKMFAAAAALAVLTGCGSGTSDDAITIGSADFAESQLLAKIYELALNDAGYETKEQPSIGSREVYIEALKDESIDLIPEYNGYLLEEIDPDASVSDRAEIQKALLNALPEGITVLEYSSAENTNTLVVTEEFSNEHGGLATISDLASVDDGNFRLAGPPEWRTRPNTGVPGIRDVYGMDFSDRFETLDGGGPLSLAAIVNGQVEVSMLFSSDPAIAENNLVALTDDKGIFPPANILPLIRESKLDDGIKQTLNGVSKDLVIEDLMMMNGRINAGDDLKVIARDWLDSRS